MTAHSPTPPRLAERLVARVISDARWRDVTLGDLAEEFAAQSARYPNWRANAWYWYQAFALVPRAVAHPIRSLFAPTGDTLMHAIAHEVRLAVRTLVRQPLTSGIILLTLALTIGANSVTFGMIDRLLLRPFSIASTDRLVLVSEGVNPNQRRSGVPVWRFVEWRDRASVLTSLAAFRPFSTNMTDGERAQRIEGQLVSDGFFELLNAAPELGRPLSRTDEGVGQRYRVVIGHALWRSQFDADPAVVGRTLDFDGDAYEIVGVGPRGFDFPDGSQFWVPLPVPARGAPGSSSSVSVIGFLPPGTSLEAANAEISALFSQQQAEDPTIDRRRRITVWGFTEGMVDYGTPRLVMLLQATAAFVLLIGCTNIAGLLLARGADRQRDLSLRLALGAGRGQIVRQLLVESAVLALLAVPAVLLTAWGAFQILQRSMPASVLKYVPGWADLGVDIRIIAAAVAASLLASIIFGLLPALVSSRVAPTSVLREGGRSITCGPGRLRRGLVVIQIALALPLLVSSGMTASAGRTLAFGPQGYNPDGVFQLRTILTSSNYPIESSRAQFVDRLIDEARRTPGVTSAAVTSILPSTSVFSDRRI